MSDSWEGLLGKLPSQKINIRTTQGEKKYSKNYFQTNISHQEGLFKKSYPLILSIFYALMSVGLIERSSSLVKVR